MKIRDPDKEAAQMALNLPCSFWWIDRNHKYLGCNIECCALGKLSPQEILGKDMLEFGKKREHLKAVADELYQQEEQVMSSGKSVFQTVRSYPAFGALEVRQLMARVPLFDLKRNNVLGMIGAGILEREYNSSFKIELEHLTPDQFILQNHPTVNFSWSEMLNLFPCDIWWIDREHRYLGANLAHCQTLKRFSYIELVGKTIISIGRTNDWPDFKFKNIYDLDESIMYTNHPMYNVENYLPQGKNAPPIHQITAKKPILDERGKVDGLMCVAVYNGLFGEKSSW